MRWVLIDWKEARPMQDEIKLFFLSWVYIKRCPASLNTCPLICSVKRCVVSSSCPIMASQAFSKLFFLLLRSAFFLQSHSSALSFFLLFERLIVLLRLGAEESIWLNLRTIIWALAFPSKPCCFLQSSTHPWMHSPAVTFIQACGGLSRAGVQGRQHLKFRGRDGSAGLSKYMHLVYGSAPVFGQWMCNVGSLPMSTFGLQFTYSQWLLYFETSGTWSLYRLWKRKLSHISPHRPLGHRHPGTVCSLLYLFTLLFLSCRISSELSMHLAIAYWGPV